MAKQNHIIVIPIFNLVLGKNIQKEIKIGDITFIEKNKLIRCRRRFGYDKPLSEIGKKFKNTNFELLKSSKTYAVLKYNIDPKVSMAEPMAKIREAIWILASEQFGHRRNIQRFGFPEYAKRHLSDSFLYNKITKRINVNFKADNVIHHSIIRKWSDVRGYHFFPNALKIINGELPVHKDWQMDIKKAVILCGKSIFSSELSEAFLNNMIALETLLTDKEKGESHLEKLKNRLNALFHWYFSQTGQNWDNKINRIYKLRCNMVHDGEIKNINTEDLLDSDDILKNLLLNIVNATKVLKQKSDLVQLAKEYEASQVLGIKFKTKMKGMIVSSSHSQKDIEKIKKENNWER